MERINPVRQYWADRISAQPTVIQDQLAALRDKGHLTDELLVIKRKRPILQKGDVFVVQPKKDIFYYGLILSSYIVITQPPPPGHAFSFHCFSLMTTAYRT